VRSRIQKKARRKKKAMSLFSIQLGSFKVGDRKLLQFEGTNNTCTAVVTEVYKDRIVLRPITAQELGVKFQPLVVPSAPTGWTKLELGMSGFKYSTDV